MGVRTITDEEMELMYYFHYLSDIKYSISELTALFEISNRTVCQYFNEIKKKIEKDNAYETEIIDKFKSFEAISKYKKEDVEEFSYKANVQSINKKLIELNKQIEGLKLPQQPINPDIELILQSVASKVDKIPDFIKVVGVALRDILKAQEKESYNILISKLDELKQAQEYNFMNILSGINAINDKLDKILEYADSYEENTDDNFSDFSSQPIQTSNSYVNSPSFKPLEFGEKI